MLASSLLYPLLDLCGPATSLFCSLDRGNDTKLAKKLFLSKQYIILGSRQFIQKIPLTTSADGIRLLNNETLAEIEGHRERLERQETRNSGRRQNGKNMKNMKV